MIFLKKIEVLFLIISTIFLFSCSKEKNDSGLEQDVIADDDCGYFQDVDNIDEYYEDYENFNDYDSHNYYKDSSIPEQFTLKNGDIEWSKLSLDELMWEDAVDYCRKIDGRMPSVTELRTLIKNCPYTESSGSCNVREGCLEYNCKNLECSGCYGDDSGVYSVFGDTEILWSSSTFDNPETSVYLGDDAWIINFLGAYIGSHVTKGFDSFKKFNKVRCLRCDAGDIFYKQCETDENLYQKYFCSNSRKWLKEKTCYKCKKYQTDWTACPHDKAKWMQRICNEYGEYVATGLCSECFEGETRLIECAGQENKLQPQICDYTGQWFNSGRCICGEKDKFCHENKDLNWSDKAPVEMNLSDAKNYCSKIGGRLPTISELRTLIQNCPFTESDGECKISDTCPKGCYSVHCNGCPYDKSIEYSVFGDTSMIWSSTKGESYQLTVFFNNGSISSTGSGSTKTARCVKDKK